MLRTVLFAALGAIVHLSVSVAARAGEPVEEPASRREPRQWEVWAGADASSHTWLAYSGVTIAPYGDIHENGVRLRAAGGYGGYDYEGARASFKATTYFSEALVGYHWRLGALTAKTFAGLSVIDHDVRATKGEAGRDRDNEVQGTEVGPKGVVELWLNMGTRAWTSLDLAWTTAHDTGSGRLRTAWRVTPEWSAGLETVVDTNSNNRQGRGGLFVRYEWDGGELSAAGGVAGELPGSSEALELPTTPYGTINWIAQF